MITKFKAKLARLKDRYNSETTIPPSDVLSLFSDLADILEDTLKKLGKLP